jgi:hypothetical protein
LRARFVVKYNRISSGYAIFVATVVTATVKDFLYVANEHDVMPELERVVRRLLQVRRA